MLSTHYVFLLLTHPKHILKTLATFLTDNLAMRQSGAMECDLRSVHSSDSNLCLDDEDRHYLQALKDNDYVVTRNTRHPLGLFSVIGFIVQQVIGKNLETLLSERC